MNKIEEAIKVNKQWVDNDYPESWTDRIATRTVDRNIKGKVTKRPGKDLHQRDFDKTDTKPMIVGQYRGNEKLIANEMRNIIKAPIVFTPESYKTLCIVCKSFYSNFF